MGWCGGGTKIFNGMMEAIMDATSSLPMRKKLIKALIIELENQDWDCMYDSHWAGNPIVVQVLASIRKNQGEEE